MLQTIITHLFYFLSVFIIIFKLEQVFKTKEYFNKYQELRELLGETNNKKDLNVIKTNIIREEYLRKLNYSIIVPTLLIYVYIFIGTIFSFEWIFFANLIVIDYLFSLIENKRGLKTKLLIIKIHNLIDVVILTAMYFNYCIWKFDVNGYLLDKLKF